MLWCLAIKVNLQAGFNQRINGQRFGERGTAFQWVGGI